MILIFRVIGVCLILGGCAWALRRYAPNHWAAWNPTRPAVTPRVRRLEVLPLGPKRQLMLVAIDDTVIGLGLHEHGMTVVYQGPASPSGSAASTPASPSDSAPTTLGTWMAHHQGGGDDV